MHCGIAITGRLCLLAERGQCGGLGADREFGSLQSFPAECRQENPARAPRIAGELDQVGVVGGRNDGGQREHLALRSLLGASIGLEGQGKLHVIHRADQEGHGVAVASQRWDHHRGMGRSIDRVRVGRSWFLGCCDKRRRHIGVGRPEDWFRGHAADRCGCGRSTAIFRQEHHATGCVGNRSQARPVDHRSRSDGMETDLFATEVFEHRFERKRGGAIQARAVSDVDDASSPGCIRVEQVHGGAQASHKIR